MNRQAETIQSKAEINATEIFKKLNVAMKQRVGSLRSGMTDYLLVKLTKRQRGHKLIKIGLSYTVIVSKIILI